MEVDRWKLLGPSSKCRVILYRILFSFVIFWACRINNISVMPNYPTARVPERPMGKKAAEEETQIQARGLAALHKKAKYETKQQNSSSSGSTSSSSPLEAPSRTFMVDERKMSQMLRRLREKVNPDDLRMRESNPFDNGSQDQLTQVAKFMNDLHKDAELDREDAMTSKGLARKDEIRIAHLEKMRPKWLTSALWILFHVMVFANFYISWMDSANILFEDAKLQFWLLADDFNCLELIPNIDHWTHFLNICHGLLSCSVLYVSTRNNATLCLAWIGSQAAHTVFKTFSFFFNMKFESNDSVDGSKLQELAWTILFDAFGSLLLLHKYYDLTDRFATRSKLAEAMKDSGRRSLNAGITYKNQPGFLQRKTLLREVTLAQTYGIIGKIGRHAKEGLHVDPFTLDREIHAAKMALDDCAEVDNHNMIPMLRRAYAKRLRELEKMHKEGHGHTKNMASEDGVLNHRAYHPTGVQSQYY